MPVSLCKEIETMIPKFLQGQGDSKKIQWVSVALCVCQNRLVGWVLEISKNLIMLYWPNRCGDWWRLIHQKDILLYKVFSAKYFPHRSIMQAPVPQKCSYAWWSIQLLVRMTILRYHTVQTMVEKRAKSTSVSITCSTISLKLMKCVDDRKPHTEICDHSGVSIGQDHRACTTSLASA